jgi:hypothetical protein
MPVQITEIEEVQMMNVSDEALESAVTSTIGRTTAPGVTYNILYCPWGC